MPEFISVNGDWVEKAALEFRTIAAIPKEVVLEVVPVTEVAATEKVLPVVEIDAEEVPVVEEVKSNQEQSADAELS